MFTKYYVISWDFNSEKKEYAYLKTKKKLSCFNPMILEKNGERICWRGPIFKKISKKQYLEKINAENTAIEIEEVYHV